MGQCGDFHCQRFSGKVSYRVQLFDVCISIPIPCADSILVIFFVFRPCQ